jgi:hypothetical protein
MPSFKKTQLTVFAVAALLLGTAAGINVNSNPGDQRPFSDASPPDHPKTTDRLVQEGGPSHPTSALIETVVLCNCFIGQRGVTQEIADGPRADYLGIAEQLLRWRRYQSTGVEMTPVIFGNSAADSTVNADDGTTSDPTRIGSLY